MLFLSTVAFMAEFNKMASVINGLATNFEMEKEERMQNNFLGGIISWLLMLHTFADTATLNGAIGFTAKTYHEIAELHAEQVGCG